MGSLPLALLSLLAPIVPADMAVAVSFILLLSIAMLVATVLTVVRSASSKAAWRRLCFANGAISILLGVASFGLRGEAEWPSGWWGYEHDIERAIGPMPPAAVLWTYGTYLGIAAVVLGTILFAVSYWLRPPHLGHKRQAR